MISLDLPPGTIQPVPGGVTDFHVTVVYLGPDVDDEAFARACKRAAMAAEAVSGPLTAIISGVGSFAPSGSSDGKVPAFAPVTVPGAEVLRRELEDLSASEHAQWKPHVTLTYVGPGDPLPDPVPLTFAEFPYLSVHRGEDVVRIPLGPAGRLADAAREAFAAGYVLTGAPLTRRYHAGSQAAVSLALEHADDPGVLEVTLRIGSLEGTWAKVFDRREKLTRTRTRKVISHWRGIAARLDVRRTVRLFRAGTGPNVPQGVTRQRALVAAIGLLSGISADKDYPAFDAAVQDALRAGMAEGKAGTLAVAAEQRGHPSESVMTFSFGDAFQAFWDALEGLGSLPGMAAQWIQRIIAGSATDVGRLLATLHDAGASEAEMVSQVQALVGAADTGAVSYFMDQAVSQAMVSASVDLAASEGSTLLDWQTASDGRVCVTCQGYEDNGPYRPSDYPAVPHGRCRCAPVPADPLPSSAYAAYLS
jgi:hypothetical protein